VDESSGAYVATDGAAGKARRGRSSKRVRAGRSLAGLIWPQRSLITHRELPGPGALEPELWSKLVFISGHQCLRCGLPFEIEVEPDQVCGACIARPPAYDRARAALIYGDVSRELVLGLKYQGRRDGLLTLSGWMAGAGADLLAEADLITPVPLHYFRLIRRGFNQSGWLAAALSRSSGVRLSVDALKRIRATPMQGNLSADARRRNVQGAFRVRRGRVNLVKGKRVLLVDDVLTTGATAEACARALKRAGAACVDVITLARVAGPRTAPI
jgi:ComF family protein